MLVVVGVYVRGVCCVCMGGGCCRFWRTSGTRSWAAWPPPWCAPSSRSRSTPPPGSRSGPTSCPSASKHPLPCPSPPPPPPTPPARTRMALRRRPFLLPRRLCFCASRRSFPSRARAARPRGGGNSLAAWWRPCGGRSSCTARTTCSCSSRVASAARGSGSPSGPTPGLSAKPATSGGASSAWSAGTPPTRPTTFTPRLRAARSRARASAAPASFVPAAAAASAVTRVTSSLNKRPRP
mmetsp:Transcript_46555/g.105197  ORF Transcript_46555/g.105197 Transcript_46555/m.105197 type:complete len:238 (-) Transcript_46555:48-761(-)